MNESHDFYDPDNTGRCQKITGVGHFIEAKPTRCWLTEQQHDRSPRTSIAEAIAATQGPDGQLLD